MAVSSSRRALRRAYAIAAFVALTALVLGEVAWLERLDRGATHALVATRTPAARLIAAPIALFASASRLALQPLAAFELLALAGRGRSALHLAVAAIGTC